MTQTIEEIFEDGLSRYKAGDRIFLLGYSRGAYAVRSLAGLIDSVGLLRDEHATEFTEPHFQSRAVLSESFGHALASESRYRRIFAT